MCWNRVWRRTSATLLIHDRVGETLQLLLQRRVGGGGGAEEGGEGAFDGGGEFLHKQ